VMDEIFGPIIEGKCRDQRVPFTAERERCFMELMHKQCSSLWFTLDNAGAGLECTRAIAVALATERFTSLDLSRNTLGDAGAEVIAEVLPRTLSLVHLDLSSNNITHVGGGVLLSALAKNRSVVDVDLSSRVGGLRNHLARQNSSAMETLLSGNAVLAKMTLAGNSLGPEGVVGISRGLAGNRTLLSLDLTGNSIGPKGVATLAEGFVLSALEELGLADNHLGDEGLIILARHLCPPLPGTSTCSADNSSVALRSDAVLCVRNSVAAFDFSSGAAAVVQDVARQLADVTEPLVYNPLPRLRSLDLANNGATHVGAACVSDTVQRNSVLEKISLNQSDHSSANSADSWIVGLTVNSTLKMLSLDGCSFDSSSLTNLAKAVALNSSVETLSLRGNRFSTEVAGFFGSLLAHTSALRHLNLSSCSIDDMGGTAISAGLMTNNSLESLHLRDNSMRDGTAKKLVDVLRKHTKLTQLTLDFNSIDFRFLAQIKHGLERNVRLREKARSPKCRHRIDELLECEQQARSLETILRRNLVRKQRARIEQQRALEDLHWTRAEEQKKHWELTERFEETVQQRDEVSRQIAELQRSLAKTSDEGDQAVGQLDLEIGALDKRILKHEGHIVKTRGVLECFEEAASMELAQVTEELADAEQRRNSAERYACATQRNLESFTASLPLTMAGGLRPQQRVVPRCTHSAPRSPSK